MIVSEMRSKTQIPRAPAEPSWLLLVHQLPPKPAYFRVKIWRRLQDMGAVLLKSSIYALPDGERSREDFQWLLREIERGGGDGVICESHLASGMTDQELRALFNAARDTDYAKITAELRMLADPAKRAGGVRRVKEAGFKSQIAKLRRRLSEIAAIDFFGATGRLTADALLSQIERDAAGPQSSTEDIVVERRELIGKIWVTRRDVHVDRMACAWLIRRFIDPKAQFKFVSARSHKAKRGELRFDMFEAEFTHDGDRCTFEVILERAALADAALHAIGEIVHDIDLRDGKFGRQQVAGIAHVIDGLCMTQKDDLARVERACTLFDDTYEMFRLKGRPKQSKV